MLRTSAYDDPQVSSLLKDLGKSVVVFCAS